MVSIIREYFPMLFVTENQEKKENPDRIEFLKDAYAKILEEHNKGRLPYYIAIFVLVYNLVFFKIGTGYITYSIIPVILFGIIYFSKYWEQKKIKYKKWGISSTFLFFIYDFAISISFLPKQDADLNFLLLLFDKYSMIAYPVIFADVFALLSLSYWIKS